MDLEDKFVGNTTIFRKKVRLTFDFLGGNLVMLLPPGPQREMKILTYSIILEKYTFCKYRNSIFSKHCIFDLLLRLIKIVPSY
ncbi:hypothetical protein LEP1GSC041_2385 [Leptospira noguchii str. 2006001870]|nr:hypothetical protein LEP1GSC041_2385 [Leptospira noguchii str. 2006001870]